MRGRNRFSFFTVQEGHSNKGLWPGVVFWLSSKLFICDIVRRLSNKKSFFTSNVFKKIEAGARTAKGSINIHQENGILSSV